MCMLTYYPAGIAPVDDTALQNGAEYNNDGHGYAIVAGNRIIIRRGMNAQRMIKAFMTDRHKHWRGPALFHSRYATHGVTDKSNCHPFRLGGDRRTVVAHNGILPECFRPGKKDARSDTRIAAEDFLPRLGFGDPDRREALGKLIGPFNKLVILTTNPNYGERSYIINERSGEWDAGIWYSNTDYLGSRYGGYYSATNTGSSYQEEDCPFCPMGGRVWDGVCERCGTCLDCLEADDACQCYLPSGRTRRVSDDEYAGWWSTQNVERVE